MTKMIRIILFRGFCFFLFLIITLQKVSAQSKGVGRDTKGYYLIDVLGKKLSDAYEFIQFDQNERFLVYRNGKFGYLNSSGKEVIPLQYEVAYPFNGMFALVGNSGKYYYITQNNRRIDSLNHPGAPQVYNNKMLVVNDNGHKVYSEGGTLLLNAANKLIIAPQTGIVEWNDEENIAIQYVAALDGKSLRQMQAISSLKEPLVTHQGYAVFLQSEQVPEQYGVYDESGKCLIRTSTGGVDPEMITLVWDQFIYVPEIGEVPQIVHTLLGTEAHFAMNGLWYNGKQLKNNYSFYLCNLYLAEKMIRLFPSNKWCAFNHQQIVGNYLFDEVLPGDGWRTPVRIDEKWFLYDLYRDSLTPLPFARIHPLGMNFGRLFVSSEKSGSFNEQNWALAHYSGELLTLEEYGIPLLPTTENPYDLDHGIRYHWENQLIEVEKGSNRILLDYRGREVWVDSSGQQIELAELFNPNIRFKYGDFYTTSTRGQIPKNRFSVTIYPKESGIAVLLANTTRTAVMVGIKEGYIKMRLEIRMDDGTWVAIGNMPSSDCGSLNPIGEIPAGKRTSTTIQLPKGDKPTVVRVIVENPNGDISFVSNEIQVYTSGALGWVRNYCEGYGCPD